MKVQAILQLMKLLTNNATVTAKDCASECGISERSVYRYVDELTCAGIPIDMKRGNRGGISLDKDYKQRNYNYFISEPDYIKRSHRHRKNLV